MHVTGKFRKERDVPMQPDAKATLEEQLDDERRLWTQNPQRLREVLAEGCGRAKIPTLSPHALRHTFGTPAGADSGRTQGRGERGPDATARPAAAGVNAWAHASNVQDSRSHTTTILTYRNTVFRLNYVIVVRLHKNEQAKRPVRRGPPRPARDISGAGRTGRLC